MIFVMILDVPKATELKDFGIQIVGVEGPLDTMSYKNKCLFLPKMSVYDDIGIRNIFGHTVDIDSNLYSHCWLQ